MPTLIERPTEIAACGNVPKVIREYIGRINSRTSGLSIAHMQSPAGWTEPGQTPEFAEYTLVLSGKLKIVHRDGELWVHPGQAVIAQPGEWVQYSSPEPLGAKYISVCVPAFSPESVHRDKE